MCAAATDNSVHDVDGINNLFHKLLKRHTEAASRFDDYVINSVPFLLKVKRRWRLVYACISIVRSYGVASL